MEGSTHRAVWRSEGVPELLRGRLRGDRVDREAAEGLPGEAVWLGEMGPGHDQLLAEIIEDYRGPEDAGEGVGDAVGRRAFAPEDEERADLGIPVQVRHPLPVHSQGALQPIGGQSLPGGLVSGAEGARPVPIRPGDAVPH